jgi:hypothetical protein
VLKIWEDAVSILSISSISFLEDNNTDFQTVANKPDVELVLAIDDEGVPHVLHVPLSDSPREAIHDYSMVPLVELYAIDKIQSCGHQVHLVHDGDQLPLQLCPRGVQSLVDQLRH